MSKVVGFVLGVVAVGLSIAATFGAALPVWVGLAVTGATIINSLAMGSGSRPKDAAQARQASETVMQIGELPRGAIIGEAATAGSMANAFNYGGAHGTDWEVLSIALADHRCEALTGFYVNDEYHAFPGDGAVTGFNGQLMVWWRPGTEDQDVPSVLLSEGGYSTDDNGAGVCHVTVAYKADDPETKTPVWPGGRPRFLWVLKGARCYIARNDSSVGGDGLHRRDDPETWEWSDNPIDTRYAWVRGFYACDRVTDPDMLLIGRGLSASEAPPENTFVPANLCDELVDDEPRFRADGSIRADETFIDVEERFARACGGIVVQREGSVEIEPAQAKATVAHITDEDILTGSTVGYSEFLTEADREWLNTVIPRYVEPDQKWSDHAGAIRRDIADVLADGGPREETLVMNLVRRGVQAGVIAEVARRLGRLWRRATVTLGPRFAELEEGDWIAWTSARRFGGQTKVFQITGFSLDGKWHNTLQLREINSSVFGSGPFIADQSAAEQGAVPPGVAAPEPGAWSLAAEQLANDGTSLPILAITGQTDNGRATRVRFEYWRDDGETDPEEVEDWASAGVFGAGVRRREIASVAANASYYAAVSYVVDGIPGEKRVLGPVSTGAITALDVANVAGKPSAQVNLDADFTLVAQMRANAMAELARIRDRALAFPGGDGASVETLIRRETGAREALAQSVTTLAAAQGGTSATVQQMLHAFVKDGSGYAGFLLRAQVDQYGRPTSIVGVEGLAGAGFGKLRFIGDIIEFVHPATGDALIYFDTELGKMVARSVEVDTLKLNTAFIPVQASASTPIDGTGVASAWNAVLSATIIMPPGGGWITAEAFFNQGFASSDQEWQAELWIDGERKFQVNAGRTQDAAGFKGSKWCAAGSRTAELRWRAHSSVTIRDRVLFLEGKPFTE